MPLTGRFPIERDSHLTGDITLAICEDCKLLQLKQAYSAEIMYEEYFYQSSVNNTMRSHLLTLVDRINRHLGPKPPTRWLDIGCNDGYLLSIVRSLGWETVGVDPSDIIGSYLLDCFDENITTSKTTFINSIFPNDQLEYIPANSFDVVTSISMFYDVSNIDKFVAEVERLLSPNGVWIIEMNYTYDMAIENGYDMISHEHITYFTVSSFQKMLSKHSNLLRLCDVEKTDINGGSITLYVSSNQNQNLENIKYFLDLESSSKIDNIDFWVQYFSKISQHAAKVREYILNEVDNGRIVGVYGASTRGNTNLLLSNINSDLVAYAYEKNPKKYGRFCPGSNIEIISEADIDINNVQTLIVMPYSFINEFLEKEFDFLQSGGKMVTLVPSIQEYTL